MPPGSGCPLCIAARAPLPPHAPPPPRQLVDPEVLMAHAAGPFLPRATQYPPGTFYDMLAADHVVYDPDVRGADGYPVPSLPPPPAVVPTHHAAVPVPPQPRQIDIDTEVAMAAAGMYPDRPGGYLESLRRAREEPQDQVWVRDHTPVRPSMMARAPGQSKAEHKAFVARQATENKVTPAPPPPPLHPRYWNPLGPAFGKTTMMPGLVLKASEIVADTAKRQMDEIRDHLAARQATDNKVDIPAKDRRCSSCQMGSMGGGEMHCRCPIDLKWETADFDDSVLQVPRLPAMSAQRVAARASMNRQGIGFSYPYNWLLAPDEAKAAANAGRMDEYERLMEPINERDRKERAERVAPVVAPLDGVVPAPPIVPGYELAFPERKRYVQSELLPPPPRVAEVKATRVEGGLLLDLSPFEVAKTQEFKDEWANATADYYRRNGPAVGAPDRAWKTKLDTILQDPARTRGIKGHYLTVNPMLLKYAQQSRPLVPPPRAETIIPPDVALADGTAPPAPIGKERLTGHYSRCRGIGCTRYINDDDDGGRWCCTRCTGRICSLGCASQRPDGLCDTCMDAPLDIPPEKLRTMSQWKTGVVLQPAGIEFESLLPSPRQLTGMTRTQWKNQKRRAAAKAAAAKK
jgi:hypothetical protein